MKILATALRLFASVALWQSSEFWINPSKFYLNPGEKVTIDFKAGEGFIGAPFEVKKGTFARLDIRHLKEQKDLKAILIDGSKVNMTLDFPQTGAYVVAAQTEPMVREFEATTFNEYLADYALDDANNERIKNKKIDAVGTETYVSYSKLLLQVGKPGDETFKIPVGFPLEVMIQENPNALKVGSKVSFKILFNGKPLFGARVKVWSRYQNRTTMQPIFTQQDGVIETHISNPGPWMVSVVKMVKSKDATTEWFSYCSTLTFGVQ
jgi:uncharacterized GH25 family protein